MAGVPTIGKLSGPQHSAVAALAPLELKCANDFDPSVTGLAAGIGARCTTIDLTKCWIKYGSGDTQWGATHAITGTFGSNVATWDTTALIADLACNTLGGFKIVFSPIILSGGETQVLVARINGARLIDNAVGNAYMTSIPWATPAPVCYKKGRLVEVSDGAWVNMTVTCEHAKSGASPWVIECNAVFKLSGSFPAVNTRSLLWSLEAPPLAEINSFGLAVTNDSYSPAGTMGAASVATISRI